jgi:hypothetical protein
MSSFDTIKTFIYKKNKQSSLIRVVLLNNLYSHLYSDFDSKSIRKDGVGSILLKSYGNEWIPFDCIANLQLDKSQLDTVNGKDYFYVEIEMKVYSTTHQIITIDILKKIVISLVKGEYIGNFV